MAILFTLKKRKEKVFLWSVIILLALALFSISLFVFPPQVENALLNSEKEVSDRSDIKIDLSIIDLEQVKNLEPFLDNAETEFNFIAKDKNGKQMTGNILAPNKDEAIRILKEKGFDVSSIKESNLGKNEPFVPYYQTIEVTQ